MIMILLQKNLIVQYIAFLVGMKEILRLGETDAMMLAQCARSRCHRG